MVKCFYYRNKIELTVCKATFNTDLRVSSLHCRLASPAERSLTPESSRSLLLRSNSLRLDDCELTTEDRASQLLFDRLQPLNLEES